ncbi:hypothetical protein DBR17_01835 [Sphingomonas sp. HMWF008]|nr:hypothetical protein DBR17_01835 [Sphingomonas sp. HMWF008]
MSIRTEVIAEIGISEDGGLYVRPTTTGFNYIYRAAMQIGWDANQRHLTSPAPKNAAFPNWHTWTYSDWLRQILAAVNDEYGIALVQTPTTIWSNVTAELKTELLAVLAKA